MADIDLDELLRPVHALRASLPSRLTVASDASALQALRQEALGKRGQLAGVQRSLVALSPEQRRAAGEALQAVRRELEDAFAERAAVLAHAAQEEAQRRQASDVTLPGRRVLAGAPHPLRLMEAQVLQVMGALGFRVVEGPLVDHDWVNFAALNFPADHPARDMQDTFFVDADVVLRTHTSNVQVRTMVHAPAPVRVVAPGMVFRHDEVDATHTPAFHQVEGLWVDDRASFAELKGVLRALLEHLFGPGARARFRPSFFPFTEPSAEVDVSCIGCAGGSLRRPGGCKICRDTGWLEVAGAGMVDPAVLQAVGYDPEKVQGFAFGMGLERLALLRYGIEDIRLLFDNDQRFLRQFAARPGLLPALMR